MNIGSPAATAEGIVAARAFLAEVTRIDRARLDSNATEKLRTAAITATAVQFMFGALMEDHGLENSGGMLAGFGLGAASNIAQSGDVEVMNQALAIILEGYFEGANRTLPLFIPKGSA